MLSFKEFLNEEVKFRVDNPGGDWLKKHQDNPDNNRLRGCSGKITGYFSHNLELPVKHLKDVKGASGEHEYRNDFSSSKHRELSKSVEEHGFDTKNHPILIGVNQHGRPAVMEGNHRLAHAIKHGHEKIHATVQYYNGGEAVLGQGFHPDHILHLHHHGEPKRLNSA